MRQHVCGWPAWLRHVATAALFAMLPLTARAERDIDDDAEQQRGQARSSLNAFVVHQEEKGLDGGGAFQMTRYAVHGSRSTRASESSDLRLAVRVDYDDYRFAGGSELADGAPWGNVLNFGLQAGYLRRYNNGWQSYTAAGIENTAETQADLDDAWSYGGIISYGRAVSPRLVLGLGAAVFRRLGDNDVFPVVFVNWKITDRLTLTNPLAAGPSGPAGLELVYALGESWRIGAGTARRSYKFRLDDSGTAARGVGESEFYLVWLRATRQLSSRLRLSAYLGANLGGELTLKDRDNRELESVDYDPAAFGGLTLSASF